jgi:hypothetical protein
MLIIAGDLHRGLRHGATHKQQEQRTDASSLSLSLAARTVYARLRRSRVCSSVVETDLPR